MPAVRGRLRPLSHLRSLLLGAGLAAIVGCSGKSPAPREERGPRHPQIYEGSFVEALDKIYAGEYAGPCEAARKPRVYALARDLDARKAELDAAAAQVIPPGYVVAKHGDFTVLESPDPGPVEDRWDTYENGWDDALVDYAAARTEADWLSLRGYFGGMISDDLDRTRFGYGFATGRADEPLLRQAERDLLACYRDPRCAGPTFSNPAIAAWFARQPAYAKRLQAIAAAEHPSGVSPVVDELMGEVESDLRNYFAFHGNPSIRSGGAGILVVPIDSGAFRPVAEALTRYIEPWWNSPTLSVRIDWKADRAPDLFRLVLGEGPTGRASVSYARKEIRVFPNSRSKTLAHEFGHVLGLPDRYYTLWNESRCAYTTEFNRADLMSNSPTGSARPEDFVLLARKYLAAPGPTTAR